MTQLKYSSGFLSNSAIGDNDLYTCPSGKKALISRGYFFNTGVASSTVFMTINVSGTYYRITSNATVGANSIQTTLTECIVLNAGEKLGLNSTTVGVNAWVMVCEFDVNSPLTRQGQINGGTGNTTVYTVPVNRSATFTSITGMIAPATSGQNVGCFQTSASTSITVGTWLVASAGSPTNNNKLCSTTVNSNLASNQSRGNLISQGFISNNFATTTSNRIFWCNILELR